MGKGLVSTVGVVAVVTKNLDLAFLTGEGIDDGFEAWFLALGRGVVRATISAAYRFVSRIVCRLKEHAVECSGQRWDRGIDVFSSCVET